MYLDWEQDPRDYYAIDVETDSLDPTTIWCMGWENIKTGQKGICLGIQEIRLWFDGVGLCVFIGHNSLKFDFRVLLRLAHVGIPVSRGIDTLVLSQLYSPSLSTGHSLGAWGEVLGRPKGSFSDFSELSPDMVAYCQQDVSITAELFKKLTRVLRRIGFSERSIDIQHRFTVILDRQHRTGFYFDGPRAIALQSKLRSLEEEIKDQVHSVFRPERRFVRSAGVYTKSGQRTAIYEKDRGRYEVVLSADELEYSSFEHLPFNLGSPKQRVEKLLELGWQPWPGECTEKGTPTPFIRGKLAPSLEKFLETNDVPEVHLVAKWMSYNGRANMIGNWLDAWNEDDSCIHGKLYVADTLRLRHQSPNTANIPGVRTYKDGNGTVHTLYGEAGYFTYESRDCWTARPGRVLVGTDAAGLELRMLAHVLNRPSFTEVVVNGDPHQYNADLVGIERPSAKTLIYAIQYGAQDKKVAAILNLSVQEGGRIRKLFLDRLGLTEVMEETQSEQKQGRVSLVDGARVVCPSPHAALNYKLQGGGARVMAVGAILLEGYIRQDGLDSLKVGDIHDEWQYDVDPRDSKQHGLRAVQAIREAGEELSLNVPLDGASKEGRTWAETH